MGARITRRDHRLRLFSSHRSFGARALVILVTGVLVLGVTGLPAHALTAGQFELDRNAVKDTNDDWSNVLGWNPATHTQVLPTGSDISHVFVNDGAGDATVFTGGGSKDVNPISDWKCCGSVQDKDDILHAYAAAYVGGGTENLYFGADRFDNSGDAVMGFWLFQNKIGLNGSNFTGSHAVGDVLIVSDFVGGGDVSVINAYTWTGSGLSSATAGTDCHTSSAGNLCATVNQDAITSPWPFLNKSGETTIAKGEFLEGGVNLSALFPNGVPCFSSFMAETRSSHDVNSTSSDFALGAINTCGKVTGSKYNDINGNGKQDNGEPGLANWTISLIGSGGTVTTTTDANGNFEFDDIEPGTYKVCETLKATWFQTQPSAGADCGANGSGYSITLGLGETSSGNIFGNTQHPSLSITKTADNTEVTAGDPIGYTITVHNAGPGTAVGVKLSDPLPSNVGTWSFDSPSAGWGGTCGITTGTLSCGGSSGVSLASGGTLTVHVSATTSKSSCPTVSNQATVSSTNNDPLTLHSAIVDITVDCPVLTITKVADASTVSAGDLIGYTITVHNNGPGTAAGVKLSDTLPTNTGTWNFDSPSTGWGGTCGINAGVLTCGGANGVSLASGASLSVHVSSTTSKASCPSVTNTASASSSNDGSPSTDPITITVNCPTITITKVADSSTVSAGDLIGYTINVHNNGPGTAAGVKLSDTLPTNTGTWDFNNASVGWGGTCGINAGVLTCGGVNGVSLASGASLSVHVFSTTNVGSCPSVTNVASASSTNDGSPSTDPITITVNCPHLTISKTAEAGTVNAGDTVGYTITVGNNGAGTAYGVKLSDTLPNNAGLSWQITPPGPSAGWGGTCGISTGVLTCGGPDGVTLASGGSLSVHISSITTADSCGTIANSASVTGSNSPNSPSVGPVDIVVNCPHLTIAKVADSSTVSAGDTIGYTITVGNDGGGTATGVKLTDTLPTNAGLSWSIAGTTGSPTCDIGVTTAGVLTCTKASLASGASFSVHITSPTTAATCGVVQNSASATGGNTPNSPSVGPVDINVLCPNLSTSKTPDAGTVKGGDPIGFTIAVSNSSAEGTGTAHNVVITDPLPTDNGLTWTVDPPKTGCSITNNTLTCNVGDLAPGASFSVHVLSSDTTAAACGSEVDNTAHVKLDNGTAPDAKASVNVICPPLGIGIDKDGPDLAHVGDTITYTLNISLPPDFTEPLHNVVVTDPVCDAATPPTYQSGDTNNNQILEVGETWIYTCQHVVTPSDPDPLPNTATVTGQDKLGRSTQAQDSHIVDIIHPAISITKTPNPTSGNPGDTVTYTFVVKNTGDTTLFNVTVVDDKLGTIGTIPQLTPGQSVTLTKSTTLPNAAGDLTNVGTASGTDVLGKKVTANATAHVLVVLAVTIAKTGSDGFGSPTGLVGFLFIAVGVAMATRKERGRVRPALASSSSVAGREVMLAAHRRSWRMRRRRGPPTRARLRWRRSQGPPMRDGP